MEFDEVYAANAGKVLTLAYRLVGPADAPDIAQKVWIQVWRHLADFRGTAKVSSWLFRITHNVACSHYRLGRTRRRWAASEPFTPELPIPDRGPNPEDLAIVRDSLTRVLKNFECLPTHEREAMQTVLRDERGSEAAARLGLLEQTVKTRKFRARARLIQSVPHGERSREFLTN